MSLNPQCQRNYSVVDISKPFGTSLSGGSSSIGSASTSQNNLDIDIQIRNVVCNYALPLHVDLRRVAMNTGNVAFDRRRGVLLKQKRNPPCFVKIYNTGKVYIVGCRSEAECKTASRQIARLIQRSMGKLNDDKFRIKNYQICNILATCKMPFGIKIEEIARKYPQTNYEPEISVGLVWKYQEPKATLRIHTTGSVTVTGATSEASVTTVIQNVYPILKQFGCEPRHLGSTQYNSLPLRKRVFPTPPSYNNHTNSSNGTPMEFYVSKRPKVVASSTMSGGGGGGGGGNGYKSGSTTGPSSSGQYGDTLYFSDEEELYEDFRVEDLDVAEECYLYES